MSKFYSSRSESPSQVAIIVVSWLFDTLKDMPQEKWSDVVISYDNMCKVDGLKALQNPLPLPKPFDVMWASITKVLNRTNKHVLWYSKLVIINSCIIECI